MRLTKEQLENLKAYMALAGTGRLVVMPFVLNGEFVRWDCRLYKRGVSGHLKPTTEALEACGMPSDWADKAKALAEALGKRFPALPAPEIIEAEAKVAGLPEAKVEESAEGIGGVVSVSAEKSASEE